MSEVTRILSAIEQGDPHAAEQLLPSVYAELRKLAADKMAQEKPSAAEIAKLRLFAGLSVEQAGEMTGVSRASAFRHWTYARAWLQARLQQDAKSKQIETPPAPFSH